LIPARLEYAHVSKHSLPVSSMPRTKSAGYIIDFSEEGLLEKESEKNFEGAWISSPAPPLHVYSQRLFSLGRNHLHAHQHVNEPEIPPIHRNGCFQIGSQGLLIHTMQYCTGIGRE
jgi:hypothetical protein